MSIYVQSGTRPAQVLAAIRELMVPSCVGFRVGMAFVSRAGCQALWEAGDARLGDNWRALPKTLVIGLDEGVTEPEALEFLQDQGCGVRIANPAVLDAPRLRAGGLYHPKVYIADQVDSASAVVGSANLTRAALTTNTEAVWLVERMDRAGADRTWAELSAGSVPLTAQLLATYRQRRVRVGPPPPEPPVLPPVPGFAAETLATAVQGGIRPEAFEVFWVEAGSMRSSAARHQLELPRHASRFFGYRFAQYDESDQVEIGRPLIVAGAVQWDDRKLVWHGGNGMERIYLPTHASGGFVYPNTGVLFRRRPQGGYALEVAPWGAAESAAWVAASAAAGHVYALGERTQRICGFW